MKGIKISDLRDKIINETPQFEFDNPLLKNIYNPLFNIPHIPDNTILYKNDLEYCFSSLEKIIYYLNLLKSSDIPIKNYNFHQIIFQFDNIINLLKNLSLSLDPFIPSNPYLPNPDDFIQKL